MKSIPHASRFIPVVIAVMLLLLAGCETRPPRLPELEPARIEAAEKAARAGEYILAAREYERLVLDALSPQRENFQLKAVDALIKAAQIREARQKIATIAVAHLHSSFQARKQILEARIASSEGVHVKAILLLNEAQQASGLDPSLLADIYMARVQAELALDNPIAAAQNLVEREQYIVNPRAIADNQLQLWKILGSLSRTRLRNELDLAQNPRLAGWIELALAAVDYSGNMKGFAAFVDNWKKSHPGHPLAPQTIALITSPATRVIGRIDRIALLLPLTSDYAQAAQAVLDGFMAMDGINQEPEKPAITVYDIGNDPAQADDFYARAIREGAQLVVGPLGLEAVDRLVRKADMAVPTLLLSHTANNPDARSAFVFQFGLPPEQEASQAAERAYLDGRRRAAVLYPATAWGERMYKAFEARWQRLGGIVLAVDAYNPDESDYSENIKRMLNVTQSEERKDALEALLGTKLKFEARRRQDIDFIFLAADAKRGRLLKPQINFYHASHLPVYSTSHIYTGRGDPSHDTDLDGVIFGDMPWMLVGGGKIQALRETLQSGWPYSYSQLDRLYALGMDSYAIIPYLNRISLENAVRFNGVTSGLSLERDGRLHRQLLWAQFRRGVPRLLDTFFNYKGQFEIDNGTDASGASQPGT